MNVTQNRFVSADDNTIYTYEILPDGNFKKIILIVHGYGEHFGRYLHVAEAFINAGFAVYGIDHRGHGRSTGETAFFSDFDAPIADIRKLALSIQNQYPDKQFFVYGHSMGSLLSLTYALKYQNEMSGLILTGIATNTGENVGSVLRFIANIIQRISPTFPIQQGGDMTILTTDVAMQQAAIDDGMMYKGAWKVGMANLLITVGEKLQNEVHKLSLPLLIMHGKDDELTPLSGSQLVYDKAASADKTLKLWDGMRHEVHNEVKRDAVIQTIVNWVAQH